MEIMLHHDRPRQRRIRLPHRLVNHLPPILQHTPPRPHPRHIRQHILQQLPQPPAHVHHDPALPLLRSQPPEIIKRVLARPPHPAAHHGFSLHALRKQRRVLGVQRFDLPRRQLGVAPGEAEGRVRHAWRLGAPVSGKVLRPQGEGAHAGAGVDGVHAIKGRRGNADAREARVADVVGEGAGEELSG
jgi:hypothetical protein